jgi:hypothetical protein
MKLLIAIAVITLWLFFPVRRFVVLWRRRRAMHEAARYSKKLFK